MKKLFTILLGLFAIGSLNAQYSLGDKTDMTMPSFQHNVNSANKTMVMDTIFTYANRAHGFQLWRLNPKGYIFGTNWDSSMVSGSPVYYRLTDATAIHYSPYGVPIQITEVLGWVAAKKIIGGSSDTVWARIYDALTDSMPGTQIGFGSLAITNMDSSNSFTLTSIPITQYNGPGITSGAFLVSWEYPTITDDTFGLVCSHADSNDGMNEKRVRQRLSDETVGAGTWLRTNGELFSLNVDVMLIPVINDAPVVGIAPPKFKGLSVLGNYPNPASTETNIRFALDEEKNVGLKVMDMHGKTIADINQQYSAGDHVITIDLSKYSSGCYYYTLKVEGQSFTAKINVTK